MTAVDEARAALESFVHALAPTKTLTAEQHQELMRLSDALIAAVRAEAAETLRALTAERDALAEDEQAATETLRALTDVFNAADAFIDELDAPPGDPLNDHYNSQAETRLRDAMGPARAALAATPAEDEGGMDVRRLRDDGTVPDWRTTPTPREVLAPEDAVDKALLFVFQLSGKDYRKMQTALSSVAFIRALEQDGYTVAALTRREPLDVERLARSFPMHDNCQGDLNAPTHAACVHTAERIAAEYARLEAADVP